MNSTRDRQAFNAIYQKCREALIWWQKQADADYEGEPRHLDIAAQLQQLQGLDPIAFADFCTEIECAICEAGDAIEQLAQTAYSSLTAVGWDCSSFEWAVLL